METFPIGSTVTAIHLVAASLPGCSIRHVVQKGLVPVQEFVFPAKLFAHWCTWIQLLLPFHITFTYSAFKLLRSGQVARAFVQGTNAT